MKSALMLSAVLILLMSAKSFSQSKDSLNTAKKDSLYLIITQDKSEILAVSIDSSSKFLFKINKTDGTQASVAKSYVVSIKKVEKKVEPPKSVKAKRARKKADSLLKEAFTKPSTDPNDTTRKLRSEFEIALNFGTPAGLNVALGYVNKLFVVHISGMDFGSIRGIQIEAGYPLSIGYYGYSAIGIAGGSSRIKLKVSESYTHTNYKNMNYDYIALMYMFTYKILYGQAGLGYGNGSYSSKIQPLIQIGIRARIPFI